jgi:hypothetical protein
VLAQALEPKRLSAQRSRQTGRTPAACLCIDVFVSAGRVLSSPADLHSWTQWWPDAHADAQSASFVMSPADERWTTWSAVASKRRSAILLQRYAPGHPPRTPGVAVGVRPRSSALSLEKSRSSALLARSTVTWQAPGRPRPTDRSPQRLLQLRWRRQPARALPLLGCRRLLSPQQTCSRQRRQY